jgi:hypothetical protein
MMFSRNISLYLIFLSVVSATGSLRSSEGEGCPKMKLFKSWSETHEKEYGSEETTMERMKVWLENHGTSEY